MKTFTSLLSLASRNISLSGNRPMVIGCSKLVHHTQKSGTIAATNFIQPGRNFHLQSVVRQNHPEMDSSYTGQMGRHWDELTLEELKALMESKDLTLVDVREPEEVVKYGTLPGAVSIPLGQVTNALRMEENSFQEKFKCPKPLKHAQNLVFFGYASSGLAVKSEAAVKMASRLGYKRARHYAGGMKEWMDRGNKITKGS